MNLSVKLITALAAFVLLVVGLVALTSSESTARAAVDAKVYVANEQSKLTNDPTPLTGYKYAGSGKTIYSTFVEINDATNAAQSSIETNSERITIFVEDADADTVVPKSRTLTGTEEANLNGVGNQYIMSIITADSPIVDVDGDGSILDDITITGAESSKVSLTSAYAGSSTQNANVTIIQSGATTPDDSTGGIVINWSTSASDTVVVTVTTTQDTTGKTFTIPETGASSGIFSGTIDLVDIQASTAFKTAATAATGDKIAIQNAGIVTVAYSDATPATGATAKTVKSTATAETGAPVVTASGPADASATQIRRPAFTGSVSDTTSGLDVSRTLVFIDTSDDAANASPVDALGVSTDENTPTLPVGTADGATSTTFTFTPSVDIPTASGGIDHTVDWQVRATDLAGNIGWSDSSTTVANTAGQGQVNTVKVDQTLPGITAAYTGLYLDTTTATAVRKVNKNTSIEIDFNDDIDASTIVNTDFEVVNGGVTTVPTEAIVGGKGFKDRVFLTLDTALGTDDTPTVKVAGSIADAAGNTTSTGSKKATDVLAPTITVALSGGSSTTAPATLTKSAMSITITSDENLSNDPTVAIYDEADAVTAEGSVTAVNQGSNTWIATFSGSAFTGGSVAKPAGFKKSVYVTADDATAVTASGVTISSVAYEQLADGTTNLPDTTVPGQAITGKKDDAATGAITFTLDKTTPTLTLSPTGSTSDNSPFVRWDFKEVVDVSKAEFGLSTAVADVTTELESTDNKVFIRATSALALGTYKATGTVTDSAGNKATALSSTFTITKRADFKLTVLPGTTLVSFPLTPADADINTVFSPAGISSVSSYDASAGTFTSAVRDAESGSLAGSLASVESGVGYVVVAEAVSALVVPIPSLSASSIPPSISLVEGWNLIGVTDVTGDPTTGAIRQPTTTLTTRAVYFPAKVTQVYDWDATGKVWKQVATTDNVLVGDAYWAYASAADIIVP